MIIAIDPGTEESAWIRFDGRAPVAFAIAKNLEICDWLRTDSSGHMLVVEMVASYGMPVGYEVFETCVWIGRMLEAYRGPSQRMLRREVRRALCDGAPKANDATVRCALLDRYGGKRVAVGTTKNRGPLYGLSRDLWQALALAVVWSDTHPI